jgi:hypothetical protein
MLDLKRFAGFDADALTEELVRLGDDCADKRAANEALKVSRSAVIARLTLHIMQTEKVPKTHADLMARVHPDYMAHLEAMDKAQRAADLASVTWQAFKQFVELKRTEAVNRRVG